MHDDHYRAGFKFWLEGRVRETDPPRSSALTVEWNEGVGVTGLTCAVLCLYTFRNNRLRVVWSRRCHLVRWKLEKLEGLLSGQRNLRALGTTSPVIQ
jgi:hypothetical protein